MVQTFLLFDTITNEKTVKFMQRDIISSTIARHLGLVKVIIIYHDFLPTPRRGSRVKSDKTVKIHPLAHTLDT